VLVAILVLNLLGAVDEPERGGSESEPIKILLEGNRTPIR
jgi:hypothetical protein